MSNRIVIAEDMEENRIILEAILGDVYDLDIAEDGKQALEILKNKPHPALVISDVMMPEMDGFELLANIKADSELCNIPVILITSVAEETKGLQAGAIDFIAKPFNSDIVRLRVSNQIELSSYRESLEIMADKRAQELIAAKETFLETMATMIEYRSIESGTHIRHIRELTDILVQHLTTHPKYGPILLQGNPATIAQASPLHDVGKIAIPDHILLKPGRLTPEEFKIMETHAAVGSDMISTMMTDGNPDEYLRHCYDIARHHHERWNGKGYPDKLAGEDIPLSARIVAIVDVYDALVSKRCYKDEMSTDAAMAIIRKESGVHFDAELVKAVEEIEHKFRSVYQ
ncbi:MAG: response regulator [Defluviitaleaceae bacterium]|nr:response regulator [Defluviitaleaceae bacterium]